MTTAAATKLVDNTPVKARFWLEHKAKPLNERQRKVINLLLDAGPGGFEGGMSTKKYESIAATSRATASRELIDLAAMGLLGRVGGGGQPATTQSYEDGNRRRRIE